MISTKKFIIIIQYLQVLSNHSILDGFENRGLTETQINQLERLHNDGNIFPKVLKELLFLAGEFCHVLDYSIYDSQQEMQDGEREELQELYNIVITRPHFFVDLSSHGSPGFIFLEEGDNPQLNQLEGDPPSQSNYYRRTGGTLQDLISSRIRNSLEGCSAL